MSKRPKEEKTPERKSVLADITYWTLYDLEGDPYAIADTLVEHADYAKKDGFFKLRLDIQQGKYEESSRLVLTGERPETDKEYEKRCKKIENAKKAGKASQQKKVEKEQATLLRLAKKYPAVLKDQQ